MRDSNDEGIAFPCRSYSAIAQHQFRGSNKPEACAGHGRPGGCSPTPIGCGWRRIRVSVVGDAQTHAPGVVGLEKW